MVKQRPKAWWQAPLGGKSFQEHNGLSGYMADVARGIRHQTLELCKTEVIVSLKAYKSYR